MSIYDIYDTNIQVKILTTNQTVEVKSGTPAIQFLPYDANVVAVLSNNELLSLQEPIDIQSQVQPVYKTDKDAVPMLTDTLSFLVQSAAVHRFPGLTLHLKYKIQRGLFFQFTDMNCTSEDIQAIEKEINRLVELNLPLMRASLSHHDAAQEMKKIRHMVAYELILSLNNPTESMIEMQAPDYTFRLLWRNPVFSHTGVCKGLYKLVPYNQGFIVRFSEDFANLDLSPIRNSERLQKDICQIMDLYMQQAQTIGFESIASINKLVSDPKKLANAISYAEFNHEKQIGEVAARATDKTKIIFVAGPSSSGKTTFANRVSCHLRSRGFEPIRVSLDDFYGDPAKAPRVPGTDKPDFEHLEALDLDRIKECLTGLLAGKEVTMAAYDFVKQKPGNGMKFTLPPQGVLVVEGIHALNDEITKVVPAEQRLRVFIQPIGALPWDETRVIDFYLTRLMRRMCRDYLFRGRTADKTIDTWAEVREGEEHWILPNQVKADVYFNSSIMYEQFVLRVYAVPLLQLVPQTSKNYATARQMLRMLMPLQPIPVGLVPEMSLLCEFLPGGSQYENFFF
ncbi:Uridine_kinase [Hexamita inflata]|uniref:Uridine kinase n=1 Tax=Hexamita inflata TaxID=28002 RepID=A0AA86U510_9EUKA|nr:Uridine kinase [Hexamita inflata]CAI9938747.1 Uridine kinase [Hexamita inflata]CAI9942940.1 Uridine kinase [Hexamita inflata]